MKGFIYGQTEYNLLHSCNKLDDYINMAKEASFDFLTITDSNLYANYKFYTKCKELNIKPIIGLEYNLVIDNFNSKLLLYAKNNLGYKELLKITKRVQVDKINTLSDLDEYHNIYIVYVFNDSYIESLYLRRDFKLLDEILNTFDDRFYFGVSYTNKLSKVDLNLKIENYVKSKNIKTLPIHKCIMPKNQDTCICEALATIRNYKFEVSDLDDYSFDSNPTEDKRIDEFINSIDLNLFTEKIKLPKYKNTHNVESDIFLKALCYKGLEKRNRYNDLYLARLNYELNVIHKMGYDDYFLIVWDFILYSKKNNILVGPGRGSAAGSLVAFCLGITDVDPIEHDLLFERFLNPERVSMPDIDTDFPDDKRNDVINHCKELYGEDHICNISAFSTFLLKSSVRDLAKVMKIDQSRVAVIIDMIEKNGYEKLLESYQGTEMYRIIYIIRGIVDLPKNISTHAAGIILSDTALDEIIPLQEGINGLYQSQLEAKDLEKIGLLKMDFLGIRNLTIISNIMHEINFCASDLRNIPLNDKKVYNMLSQGDTLGIFQLESSGITNVLKRLKPTHFDDLVAVLALYRPGPMDNIDEFIRRKHGEKFDYIHNDLIPILKDTYGIIIYQEQIMKIAQVFAGYTLAEADVLRRAVSKKDSSKLLEMRNDFITRSKNKEYQENIAIKIYDLIYKFANYGFNKSHSVAYAILSYQMAYLKCYYFPVFMANIFNGAISSKETLKEYYRYVKERNLNIEKPNINISSNVFILHNNSLIIPFNAIRSIGDSISISIVNERNKNGSFKDYYDFKNRVKDISDNVLEGLIYSGAFDSFGLTKKVMISNITSTDDLFMRYITSRQFITDEYDFNFLKEKENEWLGINLEYNLFKNLKIDKNYYNIININQLKLNTKNNLLIHFTRCKEIKTKNNEIMMVGSIEDELNLIDYVIFPKDLSSFKIKPNINNLFIINGTYKKDNKDKLSFVINNIIQEIA